MPITLDNGMVVGSLLWPCCCTVCGHRFDKEFKKDSDVPDNLTEVLPGLCSLCAGTSEPRRHVPGQHQDGDELDMALDAHLDWLSDGCQSANL